VTAACTDEAGMDDAASRGCVDFARAGGEELPLDEPVDDPPQAANARRIGGTESERSAREVMKVPFFSW